MCEGYVHFVALFRGEDAGSGDERWFHSLERLLKGCGGALIGWWQLVIQGSTWLFYISITVTRGRWVHLKQPSYIQCYPEVWNEHPSSPFSTYKKKNPLQSAKFAICDVILVFDIYWLWHQLSDISNPQRAVQRFSVLHDSCSFFFFHTRAFTHIYSPAHTSPSLSVALRAG